MSNLRDYKFFRSFSTKVENWSLRKAEAIWRKMRERKIAGRNFIFINFIKFSINKFPFRYICFSL